MRVAGHTPLNVPIAKSEEKVQLAVPDSCSWEGWGGELLGEHRVKPNAAAKWGRKQLLAENLTLLLLHPLTLQGAAWPTDIP